MDEVMLDYFPHKDRCPMDGRSCIKVKCKYWVEEKVCWDIEFMGLVKKTFNCERYDYIRYELDCKNWRRFYLKPEMWMEEREDFGTPPKIVISIGMDSRRLTEHIKNKFNLTNWEIESRNYEGGDDHDLVLTTSATYAEQEKIRVIFEDVKQLMQKIILEEKTINTCDLCKEYCESLTDYPEHAICYGCEKRIIIENLPNYFK